MFDRFAANLEMWWAHLPPVDRVGAAAAAGFRLAEIWFWPQWDIAALARACLREGVDITQIGGWDFEPRMHEAGHRERFREGIEAAVEVAGTLGAERINLNGPYLRPGEDPRDVRAGVCEALASVVDLVEGTGITLMVEPMNVRVDHPGYSLPTSADVVAVCEAVASPALGINWDLYHLQISEGDLYGHLSDAIAHVAYVQVADHPGRHEPGTGEIAYRYLLGELDRIGYLGPVGLECTPQGTEEDAIHRLRALATP
jgi:hydroxypyruvate isomerase